MNKRTQKKVAKRNGGIVQPHTVATPQRKRAGGATPRRKAGTQAGAPEAALRPGAIARALVDEAKERAADAVGQLKDKLHDTEQQLKNKLHDTEQRAEQLIAKVPGVGPAVARKLHDLTNR